MKRILICFSCVMLLLAGCGSNVEPLEADYKTVSKEQYQKDVLESSIKSYYTSNQIQEIMYLLGTEDAVGMFNQLIVFDKGINELNLDKIKEEYPKLVVIAAEDISRKHLFVVNEGILASEVANMLPAYTAITCEGSYRVLPVTTELVDLSISSEYKWQFVNTLKEILLVE